MSKFISILFIFFFIGCNASDTLIDPIKPQFETMSFDAVQKQLIIEKDLPNHLQIILSHWFDEKVKIDGFDGDLIFKISNYTQEISSIDGGKRADLSLYFNLILNKPILSKKKSIKGVVSSYGELKGDFSIKEFETVIANTQTNLVQLLSKDLKSKI